MPKTPHSFDVYALLVEAVGEADADKVCAAFGGQHIYMPATPQPNSRLVRKLGPELAAACAKALGAGKVTVPLAKVATRHRKRAMVAEMLRNRTPRNQIAEAVGLHIRTVERVAAALRQMDKAV